MTTSILKDKEIKLQTGKVIGMMKVSFNNNHKFHVYNHDGQLNEYDGKGSCPLNFNMSAGMTEIEANQLLDQMK